MKGVVKNAASFIDHATVVTPSTIDRPRRSSVNTICGNPSPISYHNDASPSKDCCQLEQRFVPILSTHCGIKRLELPTILRLRVDDEFMLVVPRVTKNLKDIPNRQWMDVMDRFKRIMMHGIISSDPNECEEQCSDLLGK